MNIDSNFREALNIVNESSNIINELKESFKKKVNTSESNKLLFDQIIEDTKTIISIIKSNPSIKKQLSDQYNARIGNLSNVTNQYSDLPLFFNDAVNMVDCNVTSRNNNELRIDLIKDKSLDIHQKTFTS